MKKIKLWLGIIALVTTLALIAACVVLFLNQDEPAQPQNQEPAQSSDIYWNVDREQYIVQTESGLSARKRDKDGFWHIRFFVNGQLTELKVADSAIVSAIDSARVMGLELDKDGTVIRVIDIDDMPVTKAAWNFFVKSVGKTKVKLNSSTTFEGVNAELTLAENCAIYDMTGHSGEPGTKTELLEMDRVCAFTNEDGEVYLIFVYERQITKVVTAYCDHCKEDAQWVEWTETKTLPIESGHYFLSTDVNLRDQQSILENNTQICLDLNGKTVTGQRNCRVYALFEHNITLSIFDSSEEKTGVLKAIGEGPNEGGVIWIRHKDGTCNLYGGTLDGSEYYLINAEVYEGDNIYYVGKHGATVNTAGTFNMYNGTIIGGTAWRAENCPWEYAGNGGAVCVMPHNDTEAGIFNMYSGEIYGGIANAGGNIQLYGEMNMYGGKIYGGQTKDANGNLIKSSGWENMFIVNGTLSMSGGEIAGHVQAIDTAAGDRYAATMNLSGTAFIYGAEEGYTNITLHQGSGDGVTINVGKMEDGACIGITASGVFTTNTDAENAKYFYSDIPGTIVEYQGGLAVAMKTSSVEMCECGGKAVGVGDHTCTNLQWLEVPGNSALNPAFFNNGGNYKLMGNVTLTESMVISASAKQLRIDLNGYTLSVGNGSRVVNTWLATNLELLTITDSSASGNGKIRVFGTANTEGGCVAAANNVVFKLYGGTLDASGYTMTSDWAGGASVFVFGNAKFYMYGGQIIGGKCTLQNGSAVDIYSDTAVMTMYAGTVRGGYSDNSGGNIRVLGTMNFHGGSIYGGSVKGSGGNLLLVGTFNMTGGKIYGGSGAYGYNVASYGATMNLSGGEIAGGVMVEGASKVNISGNIKINTGDSYNLKLGDESKVIVNSALNVGEAANIKVSASIGRVFATGSGVELNDTNKGFFASEIDSTEITVKDGGFAITLEATDILGCECGGKAEGSENHTCNQLSWIEVPGNEALNPSFFAGGGSFKLMGDVTVTDQIIISGDATELHIDLNGYTLTKVGGERIINGWAAASLQSLTITDSSEAGTGKIETYGNNGIEGGIIAACNNVTVKIYAGTLDASQYTMTSTWAGGSAIFMTGNSKLYVYGGEIIGGTSSVNGSTIDINSATSEVTIYGGKIHGGRSNDAGGNIRVNGILNVYGGEIYGGSANGAGNIIVTGTMNMTGGKIYGGSGNFGYNIYSANAVINFTGGEIVGGVQLGANTTMNISGDPKINAGEGYNLHLDDGANIVVNGQLTVNESANMIVSVGTYRAFATGSGVELNESNIGFFATFMEGAEIVAQDNSFIIQAKGCEHSWNDATCTEPKTCGLCGLTEGEALGHDWADADYENPKTCGTCGATEGEPLPRPSTCECGGKAKGVGDHVCNDLTWTEVPANEALDANFFANGGNFKLMGDVTVTDQIIISGSATELRIDLNGYTMGTTFGFRLFSGWSATNLTSLTITDSSEAGTGKLLSYGTFEAEGGIIAAIHNMTVKIYAGTLDASGYNLTSSWAGGSAIFATLNSKVYIYGGEIIGGSATQNGGAIDIADANASLTIYGGKIHGGRSNGAGGNIRVAGTLNIHGGEIYGGAAGGAGNILLTGKLNMTGGKIYGGSGSFGYNLYTAESVINFTGGEIVGGVELGGNTKLYVSGNPKLCNGEGYNLAPGGNQVIVNGALTLGETPNIKVLTTVGSVFAIGDGVELNESNMGFFGSDVADTKVAMLEGGFALQAKTCDHSWADATCTTPKTCTACGESKGLVLGHSWVDATYTAPKTCSACGATEGEPLPILYTCECGGKAAGQHDHVCSELTWTEVPANEALDPNFFANGGNFKLMGDVYVTDQIAISGSATELHIDLNGYTMGTTFGFRLFSGWSATNLTSLTITDSSEAGTGKLLSYGTFEAEGGIIAAIHNMTVKIYAGTLDASGYNLTSSWAGGSAIFATLNSKVYIYGGEIIGGSATQNGGAIDIADANASLTIYGGKIHGGRSNGAGGNIRVAGTLNIHGGEIYGGAAGGAGNILLTGKLNMTGGKIYGGSGSFGYNLYTAESVINFTGGEIVGGVELGGNTKLYVSGNPKLCNGEGYNLAPGGNQVIVNGALTLGETPNIKVLTTVGSVFAIGDGVELNESNMGFFGSDTADTVIAMKDGGFAVIQPESEPEPALIPEPQEDPEPNTDSETEDTTEE